MYCHETLFAKSGLLLGKSLFITNFRSKAPLRRQMTLLECSDDLRVIGYTKNRSLALVLPFSFVHETKY